MMTDRGGLAATWLPRSNEHHQTDAGHGADDPCDRADGLVNPEPAEHEHKDEFGGKKRLHD